MIKYKDKEFVCHLDLGLSFLKGKWKGVILCHLTEEPVRFLELQRRTKGISQKVLNEHLRHLEDEGLIGRKVFPEVPPRVEYFLTEKGADFLPILKLIEEWTKKHLDKDIQNFI